MFIGMVVALGRVYGPGLVRVPLGLYVEVAPRHPAAAAAVLRVLPAAAVDPRVFASARSSAGILGLAINYSAYEAENYRAGLLAIPRGQMEAALALGMTPLTALRVVIVPQAVRIVIPPVTNDFIALFKDTSVCSVILITELTRKYNELYNFNRDYIVELAVITAGLYLLMSYPLAIARPRPRAAARQRRQGATDDPRHQHREVPRRRPAFWTGRQLEFPQGQVAALVGPSGGGKSTLLRCINGLEPFQEQATESQPFGRQALEADRRAAAAAGGAAATAPHGRHGVPAVQPVPAHDAC